MARQGELAVVRGDDEPRTDVIAGLCCFLWQHVDRMPGEVVLAVLGEHAVEAAERPADVLEMRAVAAISRVVEAALRREERHAAPERHILLEEAPREMLRGQDVDGERLFELDLRPPVFLLDALCRVAPLLEAGTDAERADDLTDFGLKRHHRRIVEVVPVVMAQREHVDLGEVVRRVDVRARERAIDAPERRGIAAEDGIDEDTIATELHEEA